MNELNLLIDKLKASLGDRLESVLLYGGAVHLDDKDLKDDINLIIVVNGLTGKDIWFISPFIKKFCKKNNPVPVLFDSQEWATSTDVYAMEYADLQQNSRVLYGVDLISKIFVERSNLRLQCESQIKDLLMTFRREYLIFADNPNELLTSMIDVAQNGIHIFKAILRLLEKDVPFEKKDVIANISELDVIDGELYTELIDAKLKRCKLSKKRIFELANKLIVSLSKLLGYVDKL